MALDEAVKATEDLIEAARAIKPNVLVLAVRLEGANHQWRKIPPGELSIDPEADEQLGLGNRLGWSLATKVALGG